MQAEIYSFLKERPGQKYDYKEIADIFDISEISACISLNKLSRSYPAIQKDEHAKYRYEK